MFNSDRNQWQQVISASVCSQRIDSLRRNPKLKMVGCNTYIKDWNITAV